MKKKYINLHREMERDALEGQLKHQHWNVEHTARALDVSEETIKRKIKEHRISPEKCPSCGAGGIGIVQDKHGITWIGCQDCLWEQFTCSHQKPAAQKSKKP